jgi:hypothetical protein
MVANCSLNVYNIRFTDRSTRIISVRKNGLVTNELDIALVGKGRLEYGEIFNENVLHLLENFACPETPGIVPKTPDLSVAFGSLLEKPTRGQMWYNSTEKRMFFYDSSISQWVPLGNLDDYGGNHGILLHGEALPRPVSVITGYVFPYSECVWNVSPYNYDGKIDYMRCYTDTNGVVTMQYRLANESSLRNGFVNYQILGIRGNVNTGYTPVLPVTPLTPTPGATNTPTPTPTRTQTPAPGVSPSPSVTPSISLSASPGSSPTPTPSPTRTVTPTPTRTRTPQATPAPSVTPSETPAPTPPPTQTSSVTPTPSVTPSRTPSPSSAPLTVTVLNPSLTATCDLNISSPCTPEPGGIGCGTPVSFSVTGGSAPYTLTLDNGTISSGILSPTFGFRLPTMSGPTVTSNAALPSASWTKTLSNPNAPAPGSGRLPCAENIPAGTYWTDVELEGTSGVGQNSASGTIRWVVQDAVGNIRTGTLNWSIDRENSGV